MKNSLRRWKYCRLEIGSSVQMKGKKLNKLSKDLIKLRGPTSAMLVHMQLRSVLLTKSWTRAIAVQPNHVRPVPLINSLLLLFMTSYCAVFCCQWQKHGLENTIHIMIHIHNHNILLLLSGAVIGGEENRTATCTTCSYQSDHLYKDNWSCSMNRAAVGQLRRPSGNYKRLQQFLQPFRPCDSLLNRMNYLLANM